MKNGVPYQLAMDEMGDHEVIAQCVIFGTFDGGRFDWDSFSWVAP